MDAPTTPNAEYTETLLAADVTDEKDAQKRKDTMKAMEPPLAPKRKTQVMLPLTGGNVGANA